MTNSAGSQVSRRVHLVRWWPRLALVHILQLPALGIILGTKRMTAWWVGALWGVSVCCAGTDSGWFWLNRLLLAEAIVWLVTASFCG